MLSRPIFSVDNLLEHNYILHESYIDQYALDNDFQDVYASLSKGKQVEELDYHLHDNLFYHLASFVFCREKELTSYERDKILLLLVISV